MSLNIEHLSKLNVIFTKLTRGMHINRLAEPELWAELEKYREDYQQLFRAMEFDLQLDARGFAWFHYDDVSSQISQQSRQLALLFMMIFDVQADAGKALNRFVDWRIDDDV